MRWLAAHPIKDSNANTVLLSNISVSSPNVKSPPDLRRAETTATTGVPSNERLVSYAGSRSSWVIHKHRHIACRSPFKL